MTLLVSSIYASRAPLKVLAIHAANNDVDWKLEHSFSNTTNPWTVDKLELKEFPNILNERGFQAAPDKSKSLLRDKAVSVDAMIVASKGVSILTFLAMQGLWSGPAVLLSLIPFQCDHIRGNTWE